MPTISKPRQKRRAKIISEDGRLRVKDWAKLPETKPHYELIDGILKQKSLKTYAQIYAASRFGFALQRQLDAQGWQFFGTGTGFKADNFNGFVPDVSGFEPGALLDPDAVYDDKAFLVGEVLMSGTRQLARGHKWRAYARAGVSIYVLLDPRAKTFEVYRLENNKYGAPEILKDNEIWQPAELPNLRLELSQLWM